MKIEDILVLLTEPITSSLLKAIKTSIDGENKQYIVENGLYHFTTEKTAKKIIDSGYVKPTKAGVFNYSYGKSCAYFFGGKPSIENYMKNLLTNNNIYGKDGMKTNPYVNPTLVATAVKIIPKSVGDLANYKMCMYNDNAIMYEGYCILPPDSSSIVKMVPDLKRDNNGSPIIGKNGIFLTNMREATKEEAVNGNTKEDYLNFMYEQAKKRGYAINNKGLNNIRNRIIGGIDSTIMENNVRKTETKQFGIKNMIDGIKNFLKSKTTKQITPSMEIMLDNEEINGNKPFEDEHFAKYVAQKNKEGIYQSKLKDNLENLKTSGLGEFIKERYTNLNIEKYITKKGIHGINHTNRVLLNTMMIGNGENIFENDNNNHIKDILMVSASFHDVGRIFDQGPHAGNSARIVKKMDLRFNDGSAYSDNDKNMVLAIIEAHEGNPQKIDKMIKKYKIPEQSQDLIKKLSSIVRDADALDRVRLDKKIINQKVNLNPNYLVNKTSKGMLLASYKLEEIVNKKGMPSVIDAIKKDERKCFINSLSVKDNTQSDAKEYNAQSKVNTQEYKPQKYMTEDRDLE